jgi:hypothetical protein
MKSYVNEPYIRRRKGIGRWTMYGGIALSIGAVVLIFQNESAFLLSLIGVLVGTLLSQVGMVIYGRFGREPRMDEVLDGVMKGLDDEYALFHYYLGTDHALFTPAGPYAILPKLEEGEINFEDGSWVQIGGNHSIRWNSSNWRVKLFRKPRNGMLAAKGSRYPKHHGFSFRDAYSGYPGY